MITSLVQSDSVRVKFVVSCRSAIDQQHHPVILLTMKYDVTDVLLFSFVFWRHVRCRKGVYR